MIDKALSAAEWKKFAKGRNYKDDALLGTLGGLEAADKAGPEALLAALQPLDKQADALRKAHKGDKELDARLDGLEAALKKQRKAAEQDAERARQEAAEEEDASPALLSTKMLPLLRQVRKGDPMQALVATAGKECVVLLSRKAIGSPMRKLLAAQMQASGAVKYIPGQCLWEANAHTFVLATQAAGLAKKLKAALLQQTETRFKVRVRGLEAGDVDDDGDPPEPDDDGAAAQPAPGAAPPGPAAAPATSADTQASAFNSRLAALLPRIKQALAAGGAAAQALKQLAADAGNLARSRDFAGAQARLDAVEALLAGPVAAAPAPAAAAAPAPTAPAPAAADEAAAFNARLAALMPAIKAALAAAGPAASDIRRLVGEAGARAKQRDFAGGGSQLDQVQALLGAAPAAAGPAGADPAAPAPASFDHAQAARQWLATREALRADLDQVAAAMREHFKAQPDFSSIDARIGQMHEVLQVLDERLSDTLTQAHQAAADAAQQAALRRQAAGLVKEHLAYVSGGTWVLRGLDDNPFVKVQARSRLERQLRALARQLAAA